jgi:tetratricopeptide (TPR) repeat protein
MLAQINSIRGAVFILALALLFCGCTPAGPRALLKGKKCLDRGDVAGAVTQLKRATTLLATNANAWNYYGVALQRAGQLDEAAAAYQKALTLDRDLIEAHFNLGSLMLEDNRPDLAKGEFSTYTLRRPNDAAGWLKLGFAQLRSGESLLAERSFSAVRALKGDDAEAYNGLGLARVQENKPREAAEFFAAAAQSRADFAPALLNLATVNQEYLHDNKAALANYQAYLAAAPRAPNVNEVKAIVASLAQSDVAATVMAPAVINRTPAPPSEPKPKPVVATANHPAPIDRPEPAETPVHVSQRTSSSPGATFTPTPTVTPVPIQTVQVQPPQPIVTSPRTNPPYHPRVAATRPQLTNVVARVEPTEMPTPDEQPKPGFWHRLFVGTNRPSATAKRQNEPIQNPAPGEEMAGTKPAEEKSIDNKLEPVTAVGRYNYTSPAVPAAGDRRAAEGPFTKARLAEQDENWQDAEQFYQSAADTDPSWFEAQYNTGVIAHRLHNYSVALPRYELALATQPESVDARYNFALALKAAGYPLDAVNELKKILAISPDEVRAHLALANLCAQSLHDIFQAREHYLKVLALQPDNPQAADIRFWLSANAK